MIQEPRAEIKTNPPCKRCSKPCEAIYLCKDGTKKGWTWESVNIRCKCGYYYWSESQYETK